MSKTTLTPTETLNGGETLNYSVKKVILALQHLIAMFGATVLVPIITGLNPAVGLVSAGVGTLIFHLVTKGQVPVFLGSSFAFIPVILAVSEKFNGDLAYAQGGIMIAGAIYVLLSFFIKAIGINNIKRFLPAQIIGPMIIVIGLSLVPVAIDMAKGNIFLAALTLGTALLITFKATGFIKQISILVAVVVGYATALALGAVDASSMTSAPLFAMPAFTLPKFDFGAIIIIAPVVLAVFMEHVGDITTNGQVVGKNFIEEPGLNRTLLGDGLATMFAAMIGGPANTTYGENTGVLAITKNYDPSILRLAAVFAIILGFIAKVGGFLGTIPPAVMGGISLMLFSMIAVIGVKTIKSSQLKFDVQNIVVMATILIIGLGTSYAKHYFEKSYGITIPIGEGVLISQLSLAAIAGILVNTVFTLVNPKKQA